MNIRNALLLGTLPVLLTACVSSAYRDALSQQQPLPQVKTAITPELLREEKTVDTFTPLCMAVNANRADVVNYLVTEKKVDIQRCSFYDNLRLTTPLHQAVESNTTEAARMLLSLGADTHARNEYDQTPLELAQARKNYNLANLLQSEQNADSEWANTQKAGTAAAYAEFLNNNSESPHAQAAQEKLAELEAAAAEQTAKRQQLDAFEAQLPVSVRRDKYMIQLAKHLKEQNYKAALEVFPKLEALPIATDPSLKFFYGEALLKTGQPTTALQKLYEYITEQGSNATHYTRALELINQAESQL